MDIKSEHHRGMKLSIRKEIIDLLEKGKKIKEIMRLYPHLKQR